MTKINAPIDMMLKGTRWTTALTAALLATVIYVSPCQSQFYSGAAQQTNSNSGLWVINLGFFDEFQGESLKKSGSPEPAFGLTFPQCCPIFPDLTFDKSGNLWIAFMADEGSGVGELTRKELNPGKKRVNFHVVLSYELYAEPDPLLFPGSLAFDPAGNLWVATTSPTSSLFEYTPDQLTTSGGPTPASTINLDGSGIVPSSIRFDSAGDLWVAAQSLTVSGPAAAIEYTPAQITEMQMGASPTPALTVIGGFSITAITFDENGNLWMTWPNPNGSNVAYGGFLEMFEVAGKTGTLSQPDVVITPAVFSSTNQSLDRPYGLAFDDRGALWVSSNISAGRNDTGFVVKFTADQLTASGSPVSSHRTHSQPQSVQSAVSITHNFRPNSSVALLGSVSQHRRVQG